MLRPAFGLSKAPAEAVRCVSRRWGMWVGPEYSFVWRAPVGRRWLLAEHVIWYKICSPCLSRRRHRAAQHRWGQLICQQVGELAKNLWWRTHGGPDDTVCRPPSCNLPHCLSEFTSLCKRMGACVVRVHVLAHPLSWLQRSGDWSWKFYFVYLYYIYK